MRPTVPLPKSKGPRFEVENLSYPAQLARLGGLMPEPILQVGARAQVLDDKDLTWRKRFLGKRFVGIDLEAGPNVDAVADITKPGDEFRRALPLPAFGGIICAHVLEHVRNPFVAAANLAGVLAPGGLIFVQTPWVQAFHAFPDDLWRFSVSGLMELFPGLEVADLFISGGSSDNAYRLRFEGKPDLSMDARKAEAQLFQVILPRSESEQLLRGLKEKRLHLSRAYMPVMLFNVLFRKPRGG
ncbi:MAG: methyltransferase domain-containing protein [Alphaproteobacteria bacterium]|nr:methyltransferase domain-containing protein [Alphaproteobacteria bacterium]